MFTQLKAAYAANAIEKREVSERTLTLIVMGLIGLMLFMPEVAMAEPWDSIAQKVLDMFNSGLARLLAIIAVIALGVAALAGRMSWQWAIYIIVGLTLIFGAAAIVDFFSAAAKG
ncbi:MAG: TrbC/VIRB2 family protein [Bacteroidetes bacterium]|nr:TrbC/VIRB2 family protein [Bacteroidota bacterium]